MPMIDARLVEMSAESAVNTRVLDVESAANAMFQVNAGTDDVEISAGAYAGDTYDEDVADVQIIDIDDESTADATLQIDVVDFDGPLDLLNQLVERHRVRIDRVSIVSIADQYLAIMERMPIFDMEFASSFLVMASMLIEMKSKQLIPGREEALSEDLAEPGDLLVLSLMRYRRCRLIASFLKDQHQCFHGTYTKPQALPEREGIEREREKTPIDRNRFNEATDRVAARNRARFRHDDTSMVKTLERERQSLKDGMKYIVMRIANRTRVFFYELFPPKLAPVERVMGFLALLELVFQNRVRVFQKKRDDPILIEKKDR
jgi:segregation and condensation protein A